MNADITLVTFIGTGSYVKKPDGSNDGYQTTVYRLPDGKITDQVNYLGNALYKCLKPKKFVLIGTNGSAWAYLFNQFENLLDLDPDLYEYFDDVIATGQNRDKSIKKKVDVEHLQSLEDLLNKEYGDDCEFVLRMINDLTEEADQIEIFNTMSKCINPKERIILDITHGFRYMPFFAFIAFEFLHLAKEVEIAKVFYGTYDRDRKINDVINLSYILDLFNWSVAFSKYDCSKDLSNFIDVMAKIKDIDPKKIDAMERFAFLERTIKIPQASKFMHEVNSIQSTDPVYSVISEELKQRISWSRKEYSYQQLGELAWLYLRSKDYVRSVICAYESLRNRWAYENNEVLSEDNDQHFKDQYTKDFNLNFTKLRWVRNCIAHGTEANPKVKCYLQSEEKLENFLKDDYKQLGIKE